GLPDTQDVPALAAPEPLSRRAFLRRAGAASAVGAGVALLGSAPARAEAPAAGTRTLAGLSADPGLHLLRRATYGPTRASVAAIASIGSSAWLDQQLDPASIPDTFCQNLIASRFPGLSWSIPDAIANIQEFSWDLMFDLGVAQIARAAWSERQLFEVMVDFWSNHLNVTNPSDSVWAT